MRRIFMTASLALALFACDDHDHDHGEHNHGTEIATADLEIGCMHFEFGPFNPDFAAASDGEAPMVMPHNHYAMSVPDGGGMVQFTPHGAGDYLFMLSDSTASLEVVDADGDVLSHVASAAPGDTCAAAQVALLYTLEAQSYTVRIGGVATLDAVIHGPIGGEHVHDHGGEGGHAHGGEGGEGGHEHGGEGGEGGHEHGGEGGEGGHEHGGEGGEGGHAHGGEGGEGGHEHGGEGGHEHGGEGG